MFDRDRSTAPLSSAAVPNQRACHRGPGCCALAAAPRLFGRWDADIVSVGLKCVLHAPSHKRSLLVCSLKGENARATDAGRATLLIRCCGDRNCLYERECTDGGWKDGAAGAGSLAFDRRIEGSWRLPHDLMTHNRSRYALLAVRMTHCSLGRCCLLLTLLADADAYSVLHRAYVSAPPWSRPSLPACISLSSSSRHCITSFSYTTQAARARAGGRAAPSKQAMATPSTNRTPAAATARGATQQPPTTGASARLRGVMQRRVWDDLEGCEGMQDATCVHACIL